MTVSEITVEQLAEALTEGAVLVDVREPDEYAAGHVPGARNVPMGRLPRRMGELDRTAPVHLICASGNRSSAMIDVLAAAGFDAINVAGGTVAWSRSGRDLERS